MYQWEVIEVGGMFALRKSYAGDKKAYQDTMNVNLTAPYERYTSIYHLKTDRWIDTERAATDNDCWTSNKKKLLLIKARYEAIR